MSVDKSRIIKIEENYHQPDSPQDYPNQSHVPTIDQSIVNRESELEILKEISEVMREDPAVSSALEVIRQTPDIFIPVQHMLSRRAEFEEISLPGELHRTFTPLFAGIISSKRGREILEAAMAHHTESESEMLWEIIKEGNVFTSEIVVGSGVHASIYNSERMTLDPRDPALTVESGETEGGQFAAPEGPVFKTNTRTRPENPDEPNVPGSQGSLNHFEGSGTLQQADITGAAYGTQDTLGLPVRVNHMLYSFIVNETEVVGVEHNKPEESGKPGLYSIQLKRHDTGEIISVNTDRVVFASGLGTPTSGFEKSDEATQAVVNEELAKAESGEHSSIMTFAQFASRVGDESDPFPLRDFDDVAVIGPGDGGAVAVEYLLGYGPEPRLSTTHLDRVKTVTWIGQKSQTRSEMTENARLRYIGIAQEMPIDNESTYAHRIKPISGRAYKVERTEDGKIKLFYGTKNEDGSIEPSGETIVDHVVLATGFSSTLDTICAPIVEASEDEDIEEVLTDEAGQPIAKRFRGSQVYKIGPAAKLLVSERDAAMSPTISERGKEIKQTVAVWASAEETAATARILSNQPKQADRPPSLTTIDKPVEKIVLPELANVETEEQETELQILDKTIHSLLPYDVVSEDIARLSVGISLNSYQFPENFNGMSITLNRTDEINEGYSFKIITNPKISLSPEYQRMVNDIINQPLLQAVVVRLTAKAVHSSQTAILDIPVVQGSPVLSEIGLGVVRK